MKLALGTVQFGLPYGVANASGQPSLTDVAAILDCASDAGMNMLDTAAAYGESESVLGKLGVQQWQVVTKLPAIPSDCQDVSKWVRESFATSLQRLGVNALHGLLLHRPSQLLGPAGAELAHSLQGLRAQGQVRRIGVSVYGPAELEALYGRMSIDLVQAPYNVLDRSLKTSGWLQRLKDEGVEVHTRSAFLQGLLLMHAEARPPRFSRWNELWRSWESWLRQTGQSPQAAALGFALAEPGIDKVVVGVDNVDHLRQLLEAARALPIQPPAELASNDPQLINPSTWNQA
jgi:aryl-alcohol dehydrogenase-like predicted oxidoreductase